jgi:hypothetical protein
MKYYCDISLEETEEINFKPQDSLCLRRVPEESQKMGQQTHLVHLLIVILNGS